jgi:hypothetical protein
LFNRKNSGETTWELPDRSGPGDVTKKLARGDLVSDLEFDRIYPSSVQEMSPIHWTPVAVVRRAVELLEVKPQMRILDLGSGAGKFCMVGALTSEGSFIGVEQRPHLVVLAQRLCVRYQIPRATFDCRGFEEISWEGFDGYYLYNPFGEHVRGTPPIDRTISIGKSIYRRYIQTLETRLSEVRLGTRVVVFHGFGGQMPASFESLVLERRSGGFLELWVKRE